MKSNGSISDAVPGTDPKVVSDAVSIEKWLSRDLDACISLLTAIRQDVDLRRMMAQWFEGRIQNYKNKADPAQISMFDNGVPKGKG